MSRVKRRPPRRLIAFCALAGALVPTWSLALAGGSSAVAQPGDGVAVAAPPTATPIKHVIVIIGENHTFDNVFGTYQPPSRSARAQPPLRGHRHGHRRARAERCEGEQRTRRPTRRATRSTRPGHGCRTRRCRSRTRRTCRRRATARAATCPTRGSRPTSPTPRTRSPSTSRTSTTTASTRVRHVRVQRRVRRRPDPPLLPDVPGGLEAASNDLWTWVHGTSGDSNGAPPPSPFTSESTDQGALDMGFYNMATGDAPVVQLPRAPLRDVGQLPPGGDGRAPAPTTSCWAPATPPSTRTRTATRPPPPAGEIENPNPQPAPTTGTPRTATAQSGTTNGGSYSNCSDHTAPGVSGVFAYLTRCPTRSATCCAPGHYYLLNNYNPGYNVDGSLNTSTFTVPPQHSLPTIGDELSAHGISWGYYGEGYDNGTPGPNYCGICDPMQYSSSIMTNPALRANIQHGTQDFDAEAANGTPPGGLVPEARRRRRPPRVLDAGRVRGVRDPRRRRGPEQPDAVERAPRSSSPSTRAAATTTRATSSRCRSSATGPASRWS